MRRDAAPSAAGRIASRAARAWSPPLTRAERVVVLLGTSAGVAGGFVALTTPTQVNLWQALLGMALAIPLGKALVTAVTSGWQRPAWIAVSAGMVLTTAAGKLGMPGGQALPAQAWSAADVLWLVRFFILYGGLAMLVAARSPSSVGVREVLDGLIGGFAAAGLAALVVVPWMSYGAHADATTVSVHSMLPLLDVFVAGFLFGAGALNAWPLSIWLPLALDMAIFVACEMIDTHGALAHPARAMGWGTYPGYLTAAWLIAVFVRNMIGVPGRVAARRRPITPSLLLAGSAVATLVTVSATHRGALVVGLAAASLVAALMRETLTLRDNERLLLATEVEAATDALTGLANRRSLETALRAAAAGATSEHPVTLAVFDLDGFKIYNDTFGHPAGDALLARLGTALDEAAASNARAFRMGGDEFCLLVPGPDPGDVLARARLALDDRGEGFAISASCGVATLPLDARDPMDVLRLADQRMYGEKRLGRRRHPERSATAALLQVVRERNPGLGEHTHEVAGWAAEVARALGAPGAVVEQAALGGELHDIGKMSVSDAILHKPGPLTASEWEFMRRHTVVGERILLADAHLAHVAPVARSHHERWDGGGYPDGLAGADIPLAARIVAVCDAYEAMVADRPYRRGCNPHLAVDELVRCRGTQFDPAVVDAFIAVVHPEHRQQAA